MGQPSRSSSSLLYVLLGLLAAAAGLVIGFVDETIGGDYRTVQGKVVEVKEVKEEPARGKGRGFGQQEDNPALNREPQITYEYEDEAGKVHKGKHSLAGKTFEEGQSLWIRYDRERPDTSDIAEAKPSWHWMAMGGLLALGLILVLVGVVGLVRRPALSTASPPAEPALSPGPASPLPATGPETNATGPPANGPLAETPPAALTPEPKNEG